jgi:DNA repair photolyase
LGRDGIKYIPTTGRVTPADMLAKRMAKVYQDPDMKSIVDIGLLRRWFIEVGTMGEPFLRDEVTYPSTWSMIGTAIDYDIPLYFTTKGGMLIWDEKYYDRVLQLKRKVIDITITGMDDEKVKFWEPVAPLASQRLKLMERLVDDGADVVASIRPVLAGMTDENFEAFIERIIQTGVKNIHIRTLIVCAPMLRNPFWRKWVEEKKAEGILEYGGGNYVYSDDRYLLPLFKRAEAVAEDYGVSITANHRLFFDLKESSSNKCNWDKFKDASEIKKALYPYHIVDWAKKIKDKKDEIQVLRWSEAKGDIFAGDDKLKDMSFRIQKESALLLTEEGFWRPMGNLEITVGDATVLGIWDGIPTRNSEGGYIRLMRHMYVVAKNGRGIRDDDGHLVYAYIPSGREKEFMPAVKKSGKTKYLDVNKLNEYVRVD